MCSPGDVMCSEKDLESAVFVGENCVVQGTGILKLGDGGGGGGVEDALH